MVSGQNEALVGALAVAQGSHGPSYYNVPGGQGVTTACSDCVTAYGVIGFVANAPARYVKITPTLY